MVSRLSKSCFGGAQNWFWLNYISWSKLKQEENTAIFDTSVNTFKFKSSYSNHMNDILLDTSNFASILCELNLSQLIHIFICIYISRVTLQFLASEVPFFSVITSNWIEDFDWNFTCSIKDWNSAWTWEVLQLSIDGVLWLRDWIYILQRHILCRFQIERAGMQQLVHRSWLLLIATAWTL